MKYTANIPIYVQIIEKIKQDVLTGVLAQGEKLPSIQEMAVQMDVNQNTMFRAYKECETLGLLETKRGIGSFVVDDKAIIAQLRAEKVQLITDTFVHELKELGFSNDEMLAVLRSTLEEEKA
ncbi:MAG: GntR family transcriptional regulator [Treponema sp.]